MFENHNHCMLSVNINFTFGNIELNKIFKNLNMRRYREKMVQIVHSCERISCLKHDFIVFHNFDVFGHLILLSLKSMVFIIK